MLRADFNQRLEGIFLISKSPEETKDAIWDLFNSNLKEEREIADATVLRLQIMGVELAGRQKDDEAVRIINDIRGKYEELLATNTLEVKV